MCCWAWDKCTKLNMALMPVTVTGQFNPSVTGTFNSFPVLVLYTHAVLYERIWLDYMKYDSRCGSSGQFSDNYCCDNEWSLYSLYTLQSRNLHRCRRVHPQSLLNHHIKIPKFMWGIIHRLALYNVGRRTYTIYAINWLTLHAYAFSTHWHAFWHHE